MGNEQVEIVTNLFFKRAERGERRGVSKVPWRACPFCPPSLCALLGDLPLFPPRPPLPSLTFILSVPFVLSAGLDPFCARVGGTATEGVRDPPPRLGRRAWGLGGGGWQGAKKASKRKDKVGKRIAGMSHMISYWLINTTTVVVQGVKTVQSTHYTPGGGVRPLSQNVFQRM